MNKGPDEERIPFLDASRFIAFLPVFFHHAFFTASGELGSNVVFIWVKQHLQWGVLGLDYFFVLSSFLITRLALEEEKETGRFHFLLFFVRRALRIWPLYFATVLLGFAVLWWKGPLIHSLPPWFWWVTFTANQYMAEQGISFLFFLTILWSLCVEEQFYVAWGILLRQASWLMIPAAILLLLVSLIFRSGSADETHQAYFHTLSVAGNFAVGSLAAGLVHNNRHRIITRMVFLASLLFFCAGVVAYTELFSMPLFFAFERIIFSILFAIWIIYLGFNLKKNKPSGMVDSLLMMLGKRSLGLYIFHGIVITMFLHLDTMHGFNDTLLMALLITPLSCLILTILLALFSYRFFEAPFLRIKQTFYPHST